MGIIFDWDNYWALEYTSGPTQDLKYVDQIHRYYEYFYNKNISVDMIPVDGDFSKYKVIAAPVLYMVKEGMKEKLTVFDCSGASASISSTQTPAISRSGPGYPPRCTLSDWSTIPLINVVMRVPPFFTNCSRFSDGKEYKCNLLCDLMHPEGAEVLATYESDFYAGMPAVTKNIYGKGHVYYVATQLEAAGLARVLDEATNEVSVSGVIAEETGLEITCRESENTRFYFVINFTDEKHALPASLAGMVDLITGEAAKEGDVMNKWDVKILQEAL